MDAPEVATETDDAIGKDGRRELLISCQNAYDIDNARLTLTSSSLMESADCLQAH